MLATLCCTYVFNSSKRRYSRSSCRAAATTYRIKITHLSAVVSFAPSYRTGIQRQQAIPTEKSNRARPMLPSVSPYCVSVTHLQCNRTHFARLPGRCPICRTKVAHLCVIYDRYDRHLQQGRNLSALKISNLKIVQFFTLYFFLFLYQYHRTQQQQYTRLSSVVYVSPGPLAYTTQQAPLVRLPGANWYEVLTTVVLAKMYHTWYLASCPVAHSQQHVIAADKSHIASFRRPSPSIPSVSMCILRSRSSSCCSST